MGGVLPAAHASPKSRFFLSTYLSTVIYHRCRRRRSSIRLAPTATWHSCTSEPMRSVPLQILGMERRQTPKDLCAGQPQNFPVLGLQVRRNLDFAGIQEGNPATVEQGIVMSGE